MMRRSLTRRQFVLGMAGAGLLTAAPWIWTSRKSAYAQAYTSRAFIGAEGYGAQTKGWRDPSCQILLVTNLNDSGPGSFRQAYQNTTGPRIILFQVAGYIPVVTELSNAAAGAGYCYVAGQSAPGDGITFKGQSAGTNNGALYLRQGQTCVRYIRNRGTKADGTNNWNISFWGLGSLGNYIIDHCSLSYATDDANANAADYVTFQWSIIADTISDGHAVLSDHHAGGKYLSYHHNYFVSCLQRTPLFSDSNGESINNLNYNWGGFQGLGAEFFNVFTTSPIPNYDVISNYFKWGPASGFGNLAGWDDPQWGKEIVHGYAPGNLYLSDNKALLPSPYGFTAARTQVQGGGSLTLVGSKLNSPIIPVTVTSIASQASADAFATDLLSKVGCTRPNRDDNDAVNVAAYTNFTGYSNPIDETGHLYAQTHGGNAFCTLATGSSDILSPSGMSDEFITRMGLSNTTVASLSTSISQSRGLGEDFMNIEWFLMEKAGDIAPLDGSGGGSIFAPRNRRSIGVPGMKFDGRRYGW
ncbi:MAG: hypothetical protein H8K10_15465 [Nitrospira sp.]|nr:hypothetical protein [Nitrospira sp.]